MATAQRDLPVDGSSATRALALHLTPEKDANSVHLLERLAGGGVARYDAPWSDDGRRARVLLAESAGYYADHVGDAVRALGRALA